MKIYVKSGKMFNVLEILRVFKDSENKIYFLTSIINTHILVELIGFNHLNVIEHISPFVASSWITAPNIEKIKFKNLELNILEEDLECVIFNTTHYNMVFKQRGEYYQLESPTLDNNIEQIFNDSNVAPNVIKLHLKRKNLTDNVSIDEILDKINEIGIENLTPFEKKELDKLVLNNKL